MGRDAILRKLGKIHIAKNGFLHIGQGKNVREEIDQKIGRIIGGNLRTHLTVKMTYIVTSPLFQNIVHDSKVIPQKSLKRGCQDLYLNFCRIFYQPVHGFIAFTVTKDPNPCPVLGICTSLMLSSSPKRVWLYFRFLNPVFLSS